LYAQRVMLKVSFVEQRRIVLIVDSIEHKGNSKNVQNSNVLNEQLL
uniref:Transposase n=1 Tax=Brugia timori TaxID=42155 RepID=A0A0R3QZ10_9BILA